MNTNEKKGDRKGKDKKRVTVKDPKGKGKGKELDIDSESSTSLSGSEESSEESKGSESENSENSETESESSSDDEGNGAGESSRRAKVRIGKARARKHNPIDMRWRGATIDRQTGRARYTDVPPAPPPMPPAAAKKAKYVRKPVEKVVGPCDPVLCKICYDEYNRLELLYKVSKCEHQYCRECLQDYLNTHINEGAVLDLVCPFPDCETELLPNDIQFLCTPEIFQKYEKFTVIAALRMDPNARWCPSPYCNNGIKADPNIPWVFCNACKFEFCFHCMAERHDGASCGKEALEYLQKKRESEEAAFEKFKEFTTQNNARVKPCPTCKNFIEKNDGCNHMTCGNQLCKAQFCWLCLNVYAPDHFNNDIDFPDCYDKQYFTPPDAYANVYVPPYVPPRRRFTSIAKKVGIYMGVGVAVVTLGVPAAVIGGPVYGCFQLHKRLKARRQHRNEHRGADPNFVPPSPQRIAEAAREAARLRALEDEIRIRR